MLIYVDIPNIGFCMIHPPSPIPISTAPGLVPAAEQRCPAVRTTAAAAAALGGAGHQGIRRLVQRERHQDMLADVPRGAEAAVDGGYLDISWYKYIYIYTCIIYICMYVYV